MTPTARAELRRYCKDAAKARRIREPWTFADKADAAVAILCAVGFVFLCGVWTGESRAEARAVSCPKELDGRRLTKFALSKDGPTDCVYEAPRVNPKTGRL